MIVFLLILQVFAVNIQSNDEQSTGVLEELNAEYNSQSLTDFDLEFGVDLSGEYIDFDDTAQGLVRYESELDIYSMNTLQHSSAGTAIISDVTISNQQAVSYTHLTLPTNSRV